MRLDPFAHEVQSLGEQLSLFERPVPKVNDPATGALLRILREVIANEVRSNDGPPLRRLPDQQLCRFLEVEDEAGGSGHGSEERIPLVLGEHGGAFDRDAPGAK